MGEKSIKKGGRECTFADSLHLSIYDSLHSKSDEYG